MADANRLAAALRYQQDMEGPVTMNPNIAKQGRKGRANMAPPTSVMDPRSRDYERRSRETENFLIGADILAGALPFAPLAKGAVMAAGRYAGPELARGLENYMGKTGMTLNAAPQDEALRLAQQRAALPVEQHGLGLPAGNTPQQRAAAMGFDTPAYHGTKGDIKEFDLKRSGASTNTKGVYKQSVAVTNDPAVAGDYATHADIRGKKQFIEDIANQRKKISALHKKRIDMYAGKISESEYAKLEADAYSTQHFVFDANTPGMGGFGYSSQLAKTDANILPLLIRKGVDLYPEKWNQTVIKNGLKGQTLPVTFNNVPDVLEGLRSVDYLHNTTIIQNPADIRSRFAAFDPFRRNAALAAALGVAAPDLLAEEKK